MYDNPLQSQRTSTPYKIKVKNFTLKKIKVKQRTGSALVWHTHGRVFAPRLMQQVLRFVAHDYTVQYGELREYRP